MNARTEELNRMTGWTAKQRNHLRRLVKQGAVIAYVCTDRHGRPSNGGPATREWQVRAGLVQQIPGPLSICTKDGLHGTLQPHRWKGERVWLAGFLGEVKREEDKLASLYREIVGEIYPECVLSDSVGVRIGRKDLSGANLYGAYLSRANLYGANLSGANLSGADLSGADLSGAYLSRANLYVANLSGAYLSGADLSGAYLSGAYLSRANLYVANLYVANLSGANLSGADLSGADLSGANLSGAYLSGAYRPNAKEVQALIDAGYKSDEAGYLKKKK